jgi:hypothetical protein
MASLVYNVGKKVIMDGTIDLLTNNIRVMLVDNTYTPDVDDAHMAIASGPIAAELSGTGYTADGELLSNKAVNQDDTNDRAEFDDTADLTWTSISAGTADACVVYYDSGTGSTSWPICYIDTGGFPVVTNGGDLTIQWNAEGILQLA